jgi:serine/threonine protein kinase
VSDEVPGDADGLLSEVVAGFGVGSRIAGYRLEEQIGQGGMAVVFRARDERLGRPVALKILAPALADRAFRQRFIRESRAAAAVDDPHIIPVFEAGETGTGPPGPSGSATSQPGVMFIAMRYVPGGDVRSLVDREGPLSPARAAAIISPVASALDAAHAAGLVHRDVKPANMLLDSRPGRPDHVYLADFGLSKAALSTSLGLTGTGQFFGTLDYISPEQIEGKPVDGRADEYALACAAFEMLTGAPPFRREEAMAVMYAQLSQPPPPLTSRRPDLPPEANEPFARALAKAPGERYPSCQEFADALRSAFGLAPYDSGAPARPAPDHPPTEIAWTTPTDVPTEEAAIPPRPGPGGTPGPSSPDGPDRPGGTDHEAQPARHGRRRRRVLLTLAGLGVLAVVAIVATVIGAGTGRHPLGRFPIAADSSLPRVSGYVWVVFQGGKDGAAQVHGEIHGVTRGEVAQLYAQPFPYKRPPAPVSSVILRPAGRAATYTFRVTPSLATRYKVELLASSTAKTPLATSAASTVYVTEGATYGNGTTCGRPVCHQVIRIRIFVPAAALSTEISRPWLPYFALNLAPSKAPAAPTVLALDAGGAQVTKSQRVSATEFDLTISFSFTIGNDGYSWNDTACSQDIEARDGVGLPGRHGCGSRHVLTSAAYLG